MHLLFLTHRLPYAPNRGDRNRAFHLIRELSHYAEIDVVSLVHTDEERHIADLAALGPVRVWPARVPRHRNLTGLMRTLTSETPLTHLLLDSPEMVRVLERVVSRHRPDAVIAYCSGVARFACRPPLDDIPLILDMVDADSAKWEALAEKARFPRSWAYRREARCLRSFEAQACRHAVTTLVVNERERCELAKHSPRASIQVVGIGIDPESLSEVGPPVEQHTAVFCGVMNYQPNVEAICWLAENVWPTIRSLHAKATLLVVGSAPTLRVRRLASRARGIEVTGAVPDVRPYLRRAAISVAPIWSGRGVQTKVLEAVAAGLPCIISPLVRDGLPQELLPACRIADSAASFVGAISDLFDRPADERRRIARSANLGPLSWERRLAPLHEVLHRACPAVLAAC